MVGLSDLVREGEGDCLMKCWRKGLSWRVVASQIWWHHLPPRKIAARTLANRGIYFLRLNRDHLCWDSFKGRYHAPADRDRNMRVIR